MTTTNFYLDLEKSYHQVNTAIERYLCAFVANEQEPLVQAMRYSSLLGGKRLRPFLVYQTGKLFGLKSSCLDAPAAAIECIHAYSLIHDDLPAIDNDDHRRGLPTCHIKFGETIAILAGNALHTLAFSILADADMQEVSLQNRLQMISLLAAVSGADGMCLGQALDVATEGQKVSIAQLETIYQYKTGALIRAAVKMGVLAAGEKDGPALQDLDHFASSIGLAFQLKDDILDIECISKNTDKKQGLDKSLSKSTYPSILGLDIARAKAQDLYYESLMSLERVNTLGYDTAQLVALARYVIERDK